MDKQDTRFENEFEHEVSSKTIDEFNTLQAFSVQPTSLLETTLADTLGLSMHNAVTSQQQSQMTTAASVTNACARLLQTQIKPAPLVQVNTPIEEPALPNTKVQRMGHDEEPLTSVAEEATEVEEPKKGKFSLLGFLKKDKGESSGEQ
ncbi:RebB family R body protein [Vibrio penaeicida]|uniref:DUF3306 domain-containing protein n=1 Tax=Vibrio penaeicida TaxID=104609 RepID=A0AAV5NS42_9VIBR|nr:RebB family R body protein [Vibrio penaeicida]RTZ22424.1 hypothetical protein EKN09_14175 [Vibrio penaeicida]GLQ73432.1 hypothetical protein GCM10007932_27920 [Vibrio penaeicida]